jgi:1,4-alpha-glucan branching enzyme
VDDRPGQPVDSDAAGNEFSVFTVEKAPPRRIESPRKESDGAITFTYTGVAGHRVALEGDFNNWDPFMAVLKESTPGVYTITLRIPPGEHWYVFYSDGLRILDRFNGTTAVDPDGRTVSYFSLSS